MIFSQNEHSSLFKTDASLKKQTNKLFTLHWTWAQGNIHRTDRLENHRNNWSSMIICLIRSPKITVTQRIWLCFSFLLFLNYNIIFISQQNQNLTLCYHSSAFTKDLFNSWRRNRFNFYEPSISQCVYWANQILLHQFNKIIIKSNDDDNKNFDLLK